MLGIRDSLGGSIARLSNRAATDHIWPLDSCAVAGCIEMCCMSKMHIGLQRLAGKTENKIAQSSSSIDTC